MKWTVIVLSVILILLAGAAGGYGVGYFVFQPQLEGYDRQAKELRADIAGLTQSLSDQQTRLLALEADKSRLQADLGAARNTLASFQGEAVALQTRAYQGEQRLEKVLGIKVTQHYDWSYQGTDWQWEVVLPLSLYVDYLERTRPPQLANYNDLARDPKDDPYIDKLVEHINNISLRKGYGEFHKAQFALSLVQNLPYIVDKVTTPYDEYPRYPIETLFDRGGDCEDTTILAAAILDKMGYDVALLVLTGASHMALGVALNTTISGVYYEHQGKKYFYVETTAPGWTIGRVPPEITDTKATVYPVR